MLQNKNFIVLLSNQSPGAKIGQKSAAVVNITNGKLIRPVLTAIPKCYSYFVYTIYKDTHNYVNVVTGAWQSTGIVQTACRKNAFCYPRAIIKAGNP